MNTVKEIGFPVAVTAFVLIRLNGKMDRLIGAMASLERAITRHLTKDDVKAIVESYLHLDTKPEDDSC